MYYDLIASLPHLPRFDRAQRLPISALRLRQRLKLLRPAHGEQLSRAEALVRWRPERVLGADDATLVKQYAAWLPLPGDSLPGDSPLGDYVTFRMQQRTLLAALRRKQAGLAAPEGGAGGVGPLGHQIARSWDEPDFRLAPLYPWLPRARELLASGEALEAERLFVELNWARLARIAERDTFGFAAVFSYYFRWEMLQSWLAADAEKGKQRFRQLIDRVTHV